jgi:16S rRNA C967 or C1407 C5-methylase (RsmB/RsmF family)/NOL1/NOP2/fmu family ribosome biogenesis protein
MIPLEFINRISEQKYINATALVKALEQPSPVSIRLNPSKWKRIPSESERVSWCENGYYLKSRPSFTLDPLFHSGCYYPSEASGMFLSEVIRQTTNTSDNLRILDLCAAPGGKSTHISEIISSGSLLVANDAIRSRAAILSETITKWGSGNVLVTQNDPSSFGRLPGYFDIIVVDAPCSGEGMFRTEIARNEWSVGNTAHCPERQKRILSDVWPALKENGILIYSTCTFNPEENEENIKWLAEKQEAESVRINISEFTGITEIESGNVFGYAFYPDKIRGEGFFISAVRKNEKQNEVTIKSQKRTNLKPDKKDFEAISRFTQLAESKIFRWGDEIFSVPCNMDEYLFLFDNLKILNAGQKLLTIKNKSYIPSHELALSVNIRNDAFTVNEISLSDSLAYLRRDNFTLKNAPVGWNIVTYHGVNLGFVNNIGNRVNNYFPVEWRIRMNLPEAGKENIINWK